MKRLLAAAMMSAAAIIGAANAQMIPRPAGTLPNFDPDNLMPALNEIGGETEMLMMAGGIPMVGVKMSTSNTKFLLTPTACDENRSDCKGVSIRGLFAAGPVTPTAVNLFNRYGTVPKAVHEGQLVVLYHYMVADHGILRGNFETNIRIMENAIMRYREFLDSGRSDGAAQSVSLSAATSHVGGLSEVRGEHPQTMGTFIALGSDYTNE